MSKDSYYLHLINEATWAQVKQVSWLLQGRVWQPLPELLFIETKEQVSSLDDNAFEGCQKVPS